MNLDIFHAYDVRGIYPDEIDEKTCYDTACCYAELFKPKTMAVGMDARQSGPSLKESLIKGFLDSGVDVVDIGEITTDMLYVAVGKFDYSGGIVVSASHNPAQYNGMKIVKEGVAPLSADTGLYDIRDALRDKPERKPTAGPKGTLSKKEIMDEYIQHVLSFVDAGAIKPFKIVANANFGFACRNIARIAEELNLDIVPLNFEPDGSFPKGPPDPMLKENRAEVEAMIRKEPVDLGAAWDADADRVMFFDERGRFIPGIYVTALLAEILLKKEKGAKIIFDPRVVWPAFDAVKRNHGVPIMSKAGHSFMKDRMRTEGAIFAGELSAHYYFRDNWNADNGIIPFLLVLEHLSKTGKTLSEVIDPFIKDHYTSGELNHRVPDAKAVIGRIKERFSDRGQEDFTDGYSVEGDTWRFNIRPSNTEPLLRLNVEARNTASLEAIRKEVEEIILGK